MVNGKRKKLTQRQLAARRTKEKAAEKEAVFEGFRSRIRSIEAEITPRRIREAILSTAGKAWLDAKSKEIDLVKESLNNA